MTEPARWFCQVGTLQLWANTINIGIDNLRTVQYIPDMIKNGIYISCSRCKFVFLRALVWAILLVVTGCADNEGFRWVEVTKRTELDNGPRGLLTVARTAALHDDSKVSVSWGKESGKEALNVDVPSKEAGKTWGRIESDTYGQLEAIHGDGKVLVAVGWKTDGEEEKGIIVRSTDAGKTWERIGINIGGRLSAVYGDGELLVAVGDSSITARSTNAGKTWKLIDINIGGRLNAIYGDGELVVAAGDDGITRSFDAGKTWDKVDYGSFNTLYGSGRLLVAAGNNFIARSTDAGMTWGSVERNDETFIKKIHGIGQVLVAVGRTEELGAISRSTNAGKVWDRVGGDYNSYINTLYGDGELLVAVGEFSSILRSTDAGETWDRIESPISTPPYPRATAGGITSLKAIHGDGQGLVAVSDTGIRIRSLDSGKTWFQIGGLIMDKPWPGVSSSKGIYGDGQVLVVVGDSGAILTAEPLGPRFPQIQRIGYRSEVTGVLSLRFEVYDPDSQCAEDDCGLRVTGSNKTTYDRKRKFYKLQQQPRRQQRIGDVNIWETTVDPAEFNIEVGEELYLEASLNGSNFSIDFPKFGHEALRVGYRINQTPYFIGGTFATLAAVLLLIFWVKPLWILALYRQARFFEVANKIPVPGIADAIQVVGNVLLLPYLARHTRVLDAWIDRHKLSWENLFRREKAVQNLRYYPLPVRRLPSNERIKSPAPMHFRRDFAARRTLIQIVGVSGSGKTSFATQLAVWGLEGQLTSHPVVPIWLDEDIDDLNVWLVRRVRQVTCDDGIPLSFIKALYRQKRLFLIEDRLSEKQASTQKVVRNPPSFLNALAVTSRVEQDFVRMDTKIIKAVPLGSENLMGFVNDLLESQAGEDSEFRKFKTQIILARKLADAINRGLQELPVTPLLVKLYVDRALEQAAISGKTAMDGLPKSVPEVYFDYMRGLNPNDSAVANYLPSDIMMEAVKLIARMELGHDFRPKRVRKQDVRTALLAAGLSGVSDPIQRLLDNQVLEEKVIGGSTLVAFILDPIAEYVGAFAYGEECGEDDERWKVLISQVTEYGEDAQGFIDALRVTHEVFAAELGWSQNILALLAGTNLTISKQSSSVSLGA